MEHTDQPSPLGRSTSGEAATRQVRSVRPTRQGCDLLLDDGRSVLVEGHPDGASARRLLGGLRQLGSVRIDLTGPASASVLGAPRRLPVRRPIPVGAALALALGGAPTCVRLRAVDPLPVAVVEVER